MIPTSASPGDRPKLWATLAASWRSSHGMLNQVISDIHSMNLYFCTWNVMDGADRAFQEYTIINWYCLGMFGILVDVDACARILLEYEWPDPKMILRLPFPKPSDPSWSNRSASASSKARSARRKAGNSTHFSWAWCFNGLGYGNIWEHLQMFHSFACQIAWALSF